MHNSASISNPTHSYILHKPTNVIKVVTAHLYTNISPNKAVTSILSLLYKRIIIMLMILQLLTKIAIY